MSKQLQKKFSIEVQMAIKYMKEMLTILSYYGNANHTQVEITLLPNQDGYYKDHKQQQMLVKMQEEM